MPITLLPTSKRTQIGSIVLDATISESHTGDVEATDHPVEFGAAITDHLRPKPDMLTLEGLITNTPLPDPNDVTVSIQRSFGGVNFQSRAEMQPARVADTAAALWELKDAGELLTVVTGLRTYLNMAIVSLSVPRDARTGQALRFSATLKQIHVAESVRVRVVETKAKSKKNLGDKAAPAATESTRGKSLLKYGKDTGIVQEAATKLNHLLRLY